MGWGKGNALTLGNGTNGVDGMEGFEEFARNELKQKTGIGWFTRIGMQFYFELERQITKTRNGIGRDLCSGTKAGLLLRGAEAGGMNE
ncbi:MAG: hypothetical protein IPF54_16740 [Draconibacterium sp.]|nr:hypothetical protein [Draconibacterium sp.]